MLNPVNKICVVSSETFLQVDYHLRLLIDFSRKLCLSQFSLKTSLSDRTRANVGICLELRLSVASVDTVVVVSESRC